MSKVSFSNGLSCTNSTIGGICTASCGALSSCHNNHHKSGVKLMMATTTTDYYTYRFVGHALCSYDNEKNNHNNVIEVGKAPGFFAITSDYSSSYLARSIQHELSHNLGASHKTCEDTGCVLDGSSFGSWCETCAGKIGVR